MVDESRATRISKFLSLVLRHRPDAAGVSLDGEGWVAIQDLMAGAALHGMPLNRADLEHVVATNEKRRFAISADGLRIRATQGHSVNVDLGLAPVTPPDVLYHGTAQRSLPGILSLGLQKRSRQYVHLSGDRATARRVGMRRGPPVILEIASAAMHAAGHEFFVSENGVWLTEGIPPQFISVAGESRDRPTKR